MKTRKDQIIFISTFVSSVLLGDFISRILHLEKYETIFLAATLILFISIFSGIDYIINKTKNFNLEKSYLVSLLGVIFFGLLGSVIAHVFNLMQYEEDLIDYSCILYLVILIIIKIIKYNKKIKKI